MRWPFGPPHLTLKPSQKQKKQEQKKKKKTKQKLKQNKNQHQKQSNNKTKTKQTKQKQKQHKHQKETQETQKHLNLPTPKINKKKPPQKSPKNWEKKQAFLTLLELCQTHQKQTTITLKPQKKQTQKTPFCHVQKQPTIFHTFSVFSTYHFCFWKAVFCWKHYKNSVFSKTQLLKTQLVKPTFSPMSKKHLFQRKGVIFGFEQLPLKPLFL